MGVALLMSANGCKGAEGAEANAQPSCTALHRAPAPPCVPSALCVWCLGSCRQPSPPRCSVCASARTAVGGRAVGSPVRRRVCRLPSRPQPPAAQQKQPPHAMPRHRHHAPRAHRPALAPPRPRFARRAQAPTGLSALHASSSL